jgi:hypothetical protein
VVYLHECGAAIEGDMVEVKEDARSGRIKSLDLRINIIRSSVIQRSISKDCACCEMEAGLDGWEP